MADPEAENTQTFWSQDSKSRLCYSTQGPTKEEKLKARPMTWCGVWAGCGEQEPPLCGGGTHRSFRTWRGANPNSFSSTSALFVKMDF